MQNSYICTWKSLRFLTCLAMRHFYSTTTKPEYKNRAVLAHKGLQEQPEGVQKRRTKVLLFFLFLSGTIGGRAQAPPRNIGGDVMRINSPRHRLYCICLRQYATKQNTISLSGIELSEGCADMIVIYCSTYGLRVF